MGAMRCQFGGGVRLVLGAAKLDVCFGSRQLSGFPKVSPSSSDLSRREVGNLEILS